MSTDIGMGSVKSPGFSVREHQVPIGAPEHLGFWYSKLSGVIYKVTPGFSFHYRTESQNTGERNLLPISDVARFIEAGLWQRVEEVK